MIDNMEFHTRAWMQLLREAGIIVDAHQFHERSAGKTTTEIIRQFIGDNSSEAQIIQYSVRKEKLYREIYTPHLKPINGLEKFLKESRELKIPVALATSARRNSIDFVLDTLQIRDYFAVTLGAGDVTHSKPHPEMFLTAAQKLGVAPANCLVFEDSRAGIEAAQNAGMKAVVITTTLKQNELAMYPHMETFADDFTRLSAAALSTINSRPAMGGTKKS